MPDTILERLVIEIVGDGAKLRASLRQVEKLTEDFGRGASAPGAAVGATGSVASGAAEAAKATAQATSVISDYSTQAGTAPGMIEATAATPMDLNAEASAGSLKREMQRETYYRTGSTALAGGYG